MDRERNLVFAPRRTSSDLTSPTMSKLPPLSGASPSPSQPSSKLILLRNAAITLLSLTLAALWIALGPHGDFLNGRAFTVSTLDQITYVFYNLSISLPLDTNSQYRFQAWNDRLIGKTSFVPVDSAHNLGDPNRIVVSVETTARPTARPDRQFSVSPWNGRGVIGLDIAVSWRSLALSAICYLGPR